MYQNCWPHPPSSSPFIMALPQCLPSTWQEINFWHDCIWYTQYFLLHVFVFSSLWVSEVSAAAPLCIFFHNLNNGSKKTKPKPKFSPHCHDSNSAKQLPYPHLISLFFFFLLFSCRKNKWKWKRMFGSRPYSEEKLNMLGCIMCLARVLDGPWPKL